MINSFTLHKNAQLQEKIRWSEMKLEAFIREKKEKTITLPNGYTQDAQEARSCGDRRSGSLPEKCQTRDAYSRA